MYIIFIHTPICINGSLGLKNTISEIQFTKGLKQQTKHHRKKDQ